MTPSLPRRRFLEWTAWAAGALPLAGCLGRRPVGERGGPGDAGDLSVLPRGSEPAALELAHFPTRLHAFVWRNWGLVPLERLAEVVGASPSQIRRMGEALGLGRSRPVSWEQQRRSDLTVIKRNWHLLPYDQLLTLLGWDAAELAFTLREDDFLWVKLGALKPKCPPLVWQEPDAAARDREDVMARLVGDELGAAWSSSAQPLFRFIDELSARPGRPVQPPGGAPAAAGLRFCYSYFALYGDPLLQPDLDPYPEGYLEQLAATGVTGVWLQGVLYKLARFPWQPSLSDRHEERLRNLAALVARARRHGIRCFLYLNEPRAMPLAFFAGQSDLKGTVEVDHAALCTSAPEVQQYLADAVAAVCRAVPDLGGFFTITASENFTNCWSHGGGAGCPRCRQRSPAEVIAEVNACVKRGITEAGNGQELLAWDWGWGDAWAAEAIARLPEGIGLMSVSEWSLPIERGGVKATVGEYSISAIGPGPRAQRHWALARQRGLKTIAKIQAGVTWELAAIPYLPALVNVATHAANLRDLGLDGIMLGWTLGGYPSPNLEAVSVIMAGGRIEDVARHRFGEALAPAILRAWAECSTAFGEFPYDGGVVYSAPLQTGPANLLWPRPTQYTASMVGFPYDDLDRWRGPYPVEVFVGQLQKVAAGFEGAARGLRKAVSGAGGAAPRFQAAAEVEADLMEAAALHFGSVAGQARFVHLRGALARATDAGAPRRVLDDLERVLREELERAKGLFALQSRDTRLGFEASNHYFYVPADLAEKVLNCRWLLDEWLPAERAAARG